jgi:HAD superfamily hydrolase (TIGR01509 family)
MTNQNNFAADSREVLTVRQEPERALGQRLQKARKEAGFTQQELCNKAGLSYSTLAKIERGAIKAPSIFTIQSIAEAIDTSLDALMGRTVTVAAAQDTKKVSNRGVRFIYFDVNGCLVQFTREIFSRLANDHNIPVDIVEELFWDNNDEINRGEKPIEELNALFSAKFNADFDWMEYYLDTVQPIPGMIDLLEWVAQHYHVGLLTNTMPGFVEALQARGKIPPIQFDSIIDSSVVRAMKPDPEIYEIAQREANVPGSEILFVDDTRTNLVAAKKFEWHTIWFDSYRPEDSINTVRQALEFTE